MNYIYFPIKYIISIIISVYEYFFGNICTLNDYLSMEDRKKIAKLRMKRLGRISKIKSKMSRINPTKRIKNISNCYITYHIENDDKKHEQIAQD